MNSRGGDMNNGYPRGKYSYNYRPNHDGQSYPVKGDMNRVYGPSAVKQDNSNEGLSPRDQQDLLRLLKSFVGKNG